MRIFIPSKSLIFLLILINIGCSNRQRAEQANVVLIMTDDQGWGDFTSHGNEIIETPNIDAFAGQGARFSRFYVSPVCSPTRAALLTGRYAARSGVYATTRGKEKMRLDEITIADLFQQAGYATGCFGKWHNGAQFPYTPNGRGFDEFLGFCNGHYYSYFDMPLLHNGVRIEKKGYITDVFTDEAMKFIEENQDVPFFCYVPYNTPHFPNQVPDKYFDKYKEKGLDDGLAAIYAMCENIDDNVGRLLEHVDKLGLADNTIVLFLTDNGPNTERYTEYLRGKKGHVYEGGVRAPLFVRWPGKIVPGTEIDRIAAHIDLLPTLTDICNIPVPHADKLDGVSLKSLLLNAHPGGDGDAGGEDDGAAEWPDRLIYTWWQGSSPDLRGAVRGQKWSAVLHKGDEWELFDLENDPSQTTDLAEQYPDILQKLSDNYLSWFKEAGAKGFRLMPIPVGHKEQAVVELHAHEGEMHPGMGEGINYSRQPGYDFDFITQWTDTDSYISWPVEIVRAGSYKVSARYACPEEDLGVELLVKAGDSSLKKVVDIPYASKSIIRPDRAPKMPIYIKDNGWGIFELGSMEIPVGEFELELHSLNIPGSQAIEIRDIILSSE